MPRTTELEELQNRIQQAQTTIARAEAVSEEIQKDWKENLGTTDPAEVAEKLAEMEKRLAALSERYEKDLSDARAILDEAGI